MSRIIPSIVSIFIFLMLFHLLGWLRQLDEKMDIHTRMLAREQLFSESLVRLRDKQAEIDKLKKEYELCTEGNMALRAYLHKLELELEKRDTWIPKEHRKFL